ncbi:MAG: GNAT family N-acetyltransferase [Oscillospiraceae bacterium]|nr:GNAT family N-acetyltransferase [Oscillospiraceae bacterium]
MEIKLADFSHRQELLELWREAFGDSEDYILSFLNGYFIPEYNAPVAVFDGKIISALYLVEFELYSGRSPIGTCAYLFAAATRAEYRGQGYMGHLIEYAAELYKNRGISAIFLFPQENAGKLFDYYAKFGFLPLYQTKKISVQKHMRDIDLTGFRLMDRRLDDTEMFDRLYAAYAEFTAKQHLSPLKDRLFYFKCASSYLDSPESHFAVLECGKNNNVKEFCYVFYRKFGNNYYIDDIIITECAEYDKSAAFLTEIMLKLGDDINIEMNVLPENFSEHKLAMILPLTETVEAVIKKLDKPVYLNMFMNI